VGVLQIRHQATLENRESHQGEKNRTRIKSGIKKTCGVLHGSEVIWMAGATGKASL